jgi:hypothetical protein
LGTLWVLETKCGEIKSDGECDCRVADTELRCTFKDLMQIFVLGRLSLVAVVQATDLCTAKMGPIAGG